jgi:hypothetical protein
MREEEERQKQEAPPFLNMPKIVAATDWNDENNKIAPPCLCFLNANNISLA